MAAKGPENASVAPHPRMMVGRYPIFDRDRKVVAYEVLFRPSGPMDEAEVTPEEATARVISDTLVSLGLEKLTHNRRAFIRTPLSFLQHDVIKLLPADRVVLQVPCAEGEEQAVTDACTRLKETGYTIALEDVVPTGSTAALFGLAEFAKVDFPSTGGGDIQSYRTHGTRLSTNVIASRIDRVDDFEAAHRAGYTHFQGFFFGEPVALERRAIPTGKLTNLRLLRALHNPNLSLNELEELVKHDASLCHRILQAVNSAAFAQRHEVTSMHHALLLLGRDTMRRWASLWVLADLGSEAGSEVVINASVRARFCEQLASRAGGQDAAGEGFLLGMCSMLDVMMGRPMPLVLAELPLAPDVAAALIGQDNPMRRLLDCVIAYERGDWARCLELGRAIGLDEVSLQAAYFDALKWADEVNQPTGPGGRRRPTQM